MHHAARLASVVAVALASASCSDTTAPDTRHIVPIYGISVTPNATMSDTIRVSFFEGAGQCDTGVVVAQELTATGTRFSVSSVPPTEPCIVPAIYVPPIPRVYLIAPRHVTPYVINFAEPNAADSVRTVAP